GVKAKPEDSVPDASDEAVEDPGGTVDPDSIPDDDDAEGSLGADEDEEEDDDEPSSRSSDFAAVGDDDLAPMDDDLPRSRTETRVRAVDEEDGADEEPADDATRAGPPIKLQITAGPDAGKTKKFTGVRMFIGRTNGCELK